MLDIERGWEEFNKFENYVFKPDDEDFFQFTGKWNIRCIVLFQQFLEIFTFLIPSLLRLSIFKKNFKILYFYYFKFVTQSLKRRNFGFLKIKEKFMVIWDKIKVKVQD